MKYITSIKLILASAVLISFSCNRALDAPPEFQEPQVTVNMTIKELKALHTMGTFTQISDDKIISGIVVSEDKTGNFYKSICIQDATGGITLRLDGSSLFTNYPVGRRLYVKLKNLYIGDYNRLIQIGAGIDNSDPTRPELSPLPASLFDKFILKGSTGNTVTPKVVTVAQLADSLQSMLIQLQGFEFNAADTAKTYADAVGKNSVNYTIRNCSGDRIVLRNSGYATFAGYKLPNGNGNITAIYSVFGSTKQLLIRDTADVQFKGSRCAPTGPQTLLFQDFETVTNNADINLPGWKNIDEVGGEKWSGGSVTSLTKFAKISAFGSNQPVVKSWLITPGVNLDNTVGEILTFKSIDGFNNGATLKVYYSTDYTGNNTPWTATWTQLPATIASGTTSGYRSSWLNSGNINLGNINGTVYIAFVYEGGDPAGTANDKTTTYEIDEVKIIGY